MKTYLALCAIGLVTFSATAQSNSTVDTLNANLEECYQQTQSTYPKSKRACNAIIRSELSIRESKAIAYHNRGIINLKMGNRDNALADFRKALIRSPELTMSKAAIAQLAKNEHPALAKNQKK